MIDCLVLVCVHNGFVYTMGVCTQWVWFQLTGNYLLEWVGSNTPLMDVVGVVICTACHMKTQRELKNVVKLSHSCTTCIDVYASA